jgi:hypothetical protein
MRQKRLDYQWIEGGWPLPSHGWGHRFNPCRAHHLGMYGFAASACCIATLAAACRSPSELVARWLRDPIGLNSAGQDFSNFFYRIPLSLTRSFTPRLVVKKKLPLRDKCA